MICFVLLLHNVLVNSYGNVEMVTSGFVGLCPGIETKVSSSPVIKYYPSNITQTCPCNILQYFTAVKMKYFR